VSDGLVIRKLRAADLPMFFEPAQLANGEKWLGLQERDWMYVAVAEVNGEAVGKTCLMFNFMGDPPNAYSFASAVRPEWRSQGIGSALVAHTERVARSRGLFRITAHTATTNPRAASWRERMGYRRIGEETIHWTEPDGTRVDSPSWMYERMFAIPASHRVRRWVRKRLPRWRKRLMALLGRSTEPRR
jgi:ribosomal protein S18 acetylase RimI-like enzyme